MGWLRRHWRKVAGVVIGIVGSLSGDATVATAAVGLGGAVLGSDFQIGAQLGTPIGRSAKELVKR